MSHPRFPLNFSDAPHFGSKKWGISTIRRAKFKLRIRIFWKVEIPANPAMQENETQARREPKPRSNGPSPLPETLCRKGASPPARRAKYTGRLLVNLLPTNASDPFFNTGRLLVNLGMCPASPNETSYARIVPYNIKTTTHHPHI